MDKTRLTELRFEYEQRRLEYLEKKMEFHEKSTRRKAYIRMALGVFLGGIVVSSLIFLFQKEVPPGNRDIIIALVSGLTGAFFGSVINYYFGDSDNHAEPVASMGEHEGMGSSDEPKKEPPEITDGP
ncbi:MAG: hypothetical protein LC687_00215 [Actinobacteria bacterium]|nr:hypothetical protein [Actinomycetota bacterium]MCA1806294.1 hypothetical protein [Actinomycetota bacterium]